MRLILSIKELIAKPSEVLIDTGFELFGGGGGALSIRRLELLGGFV